MQPDSEHSYVHLCGNIILVVLVAASRNHTQSAMFLHRIIESVGTPCPTQSFASGSSSPSYTSNPNRWERMSSNEGVSNDSLWLPAQDAFRTCVAFLVSQTGLAQLAKTYFLLYRFSSIPSAIHLHSSCCRRQFEIIQNAQKESDVKGRIVGFGQPHIVSRLRSGHDAAEQFAQPPGVRKVGQFGVNLLGILIDGRQQGCQGSKFGRLQPRQTGIGLAVKEQSLFEAFGEIDFEALSMKPQGQIVVQDGLQGIHRNSVVVKVVILVVA